MELSTQENARSSGRYILMPRLSDEPLNRIGQELSPGGSRRSGELMIQLGKIVKASAAGRPGRKY
ncbi:hypothetical protein [Gelria sp. Kuro-4]|uniref:hypothetical protein n=1 Tax=Gelria sp. Kuro-4 TaxID=2796927 RepID=UPI001BEDF15F|nr:hypothetical protein [Gelria sp. Kuro-4]BCV24491.1 hypothetical protein kuro4_12640 [Gelria sp. Kuro-4]